MLRRMSSREIVQWQAYEHVDGPLGLARHDHLIALLAFYTLRAMGVKQADVDKIVPKWDKGRRRMTSEEMERIAQKIAKTFG